MLSQYSYFQNNVWAPNLSPEFQWHVPPLLSWTHNDQQKFWNVRIIRGKYHFIQKSKYKKKKIHHLEARRLWENTVRIIKDSKVFKSAPDSNAVIKKNTEKSNYNISSNTEMSLSYN